MKLPLPSRLGLAVAVSLVLGAVPPLAHAGLAEPGSPPGLKPVRPPAARPAPRPQVRPVPPPQKQGHLPQWIDRHSNLSLPEQLKALDKEPGFKETPAQTQQQMRDQLVRLHNMTPEQRSRLLDRNEALEQMTPVQRQQFNSSVSQYRSLPPDRKRLVAKAFHDLREFPQGERQAIMNSERFRAEFSDSERATLGNLLTWEPYFTQGASPEGP